MSKNITAYVIEETASGNRYVLKGSTGFAGSFDETFKYENISLGDNAKIHDTFFMHEIETDNNWEYFVTGIIEVYEEAELSQITTHKIIGQQ
tara:strand:+ start:1534 stop:1809 length:276 start_codon:yes stop_codon:yes gene_type:complete